MAEMPKDQDEARLEQLAKRLLSTPPEPRDKRKAMRSAERKKQERKPAK